MMAIQLGKQALLSIDRLAQQTFLHQPSGAIVVGFRPLDIRYIR